MKKSKKIYAILLAATLAVTLLLTAVATPQTPLRDATPSEKISDGAYVGYSAVASNVSTRVNGKIWLDKSVSASGQMFAENNGYALKNDEFEVALSALSQAFPITSTEQIMHKKANVVFAIDVSTSMVNNSLMVDGVNRQRLWILKEVGKNFIDSLVGLGSEYTINVSIVLYNGQSFVHQTWTLLDSTSQESMKQRIDEVTTVTTAYCTGATATDNTNSQAGAYLARMMYDDAYADSFNRPLDYDDSNTNNFVIFMTDGAPNRYYTTGTTGTPGTQTSGVAPIDIEYDATNGVYYTVPSYISRRVLASTDYKKMAAYTLLQQIEQMRTINNVTVFSLGLGEWFVEEEETSGFPTGTNLCQLVAAAGNGTIDPSNGDIITADYAWNHYLGYDVPDGAMPGGNPTFPLTADSDATTKSHFYDGTYYYFLKKNGGTKHYFNTWQDMLDAMNLPNPSDTFIDAKTGDSVTKEAAFITTAVRREDALFPTIESCGIPYVPPNVLSQVTYYYAGNTAERFETSMQDIVSAITVSFANYVTSTTTTGDPLVDGLIKFVDTVGDGMRVTRFLGVNFDDIFCTCADEAQYFLNYSAQVQTPEEIAAIDQWCNELRFSYGAQVNRTLIDRLIETSVAGGSIYYNSDTDCASMLSMYTRYVGATGIYQYLAPYYYSDGSVAEVPEGATHLTRQILVSNDASGEILAGGTTSLLYLQLAIVESLDTGAQKMVMNIPASLVPTREVAVIGGQAHLNTPASPMSAVYCVGLRDDLSAQQLANSASTDENGDTVHKFYSNNWLDAAALEQDDAQTAYVHYTASELSPYYQAIEDTLLYVADASQPSGYRPAVEGDEGTFYVYGVIYDASGEISAHMPMLDFYPQGIPTLMTKENTTNYYLPEGTLRYDSEIEEDRDKLNGNITGTNPQAYNAAFSGAVGTAINVHIQLGNNGVLTVGEREVEDSVVLDYGLPVAIDLTAFDVLTAADAPVATAVGLTSATADSQSVELEHGTLYVKDGTLCYQPQGTQFDAIDSGGFVCKTVTDGALSLCRGTVYVIPATNITYEEDFLTFTDADGAAWSNQGSAIQAYQSSENFCYGYDAAYENPSPDSLGSSMMATVSDPFVQPTAQFTFTGNAFDIFSRTGADCGVMLVEVHDGDVTGPLEKVLIVDNYLNADTLYQLPVVHYLCKTHGTYSVKIIAYYNMVFDHAMRAPASIAAVRKTMGYAADTPMQYSKTCPQINTTRAPAASVAGQYNVYIDGIRIYNPLGAALTQGIAYTAYSAASELNPTYVQVRSSLLSVQSWNDTQEVTIDGAVYLAGLGEGTTAGQSVSRQGIYLSSEGQIKMNGDGALLDVQGNLLKITVDGSEYDVYCYEGELTQVKQDDSKIVFTDDAGNILFSRLYYLVSGDTRVYLTSQQESALNICFYDDIYKTDSPENEVYLKNGQAIAFQVDSSNTTQLSAKSPNGKPVQLCIYDTQQELWVEFNPITCRAEQYTNLTQWIHGGVCILKCKAADSDAILSVVNIKITDHSGRAGAMRSSLPLVYSSRNALENENSIEANHVHSYTQQVIALATCTTDGVAEMVCRCGDRYDTVLTKTGHAWNAGEVTTPATCLTDGEKTYTCTACDATKTENIAAAGAHTWNAGEVTTPATCLTDGGKTYTCTACGETKTDRIAAAGAHKWNKGETTTPATCLTDGEKTYTCTACGETETENIAAAGAHKWNMGEITKAATCLTDGEKTYTCTACGETETENIAAAGAHKWNAGEITKAAACLTDGEKTYTCTVCGETRTEPIPASETHSWGEGIIAREETCTAAGTLSITCKTCGLTNNATIAARGHQWDNGKLIVLPSCTRVGTMLFTCTVCGETRTEDVSKQEHIYADGVCTNCGMEDPNFTDVAFTDVAQDKWYAEAISYVSTEKLMTGINKEQFDPEGTMTRAMLITVLWRLEGEPLGSKSKFLDVPTSEWYTLAVAWAAEKGIVVGTGTTTFAPNDNVTREQMATILYRYCTYKDCGLPATASMQNFTDAKRVSSWADEAVLWAVSNGVINGMPSGEICPKALATRAQAATVLMRTRKLLAKASE